MTIKEFAAKYKLKVRHDSCGDPILAGRLGATDAPTHRWVRREGVLIKVPIPKRWENHHHIYDHGDGRHLGICLMHGTARKGRFALRKLVAAGFELKQQGHSEGTALFDPENRKQARLAIKLAGCKRKKRLTPEAIEVVTKRLRAMHEARIKAKAVA